LDEEMEKVFSEPGLTKFDVRKLSDINKPASTSKLDDEQHKKTYKGIRNMSKKESSDPTSPISDSGGYGNENDTVSRQSNFSSYADYTSRDVSEEIDDDEPPLSERVATYRDDDVCD
jgi:hypothetical protein